MIYRRELHGISSTIAGRGAEFAHVSPGDIRIFLHARQSQSTGLPESGRRRPTTCARGPALTPGRKECCTDAVRSGALGEQWSCLRIAAPGSSLQAPAETGAAWRGLIRTGARRLSTGAIVAIGQHSTCRPVSTAISGRWTPAHAGRRPGRPDSPLRCNRPSSERRRLGCNR